MRKKQVKRYNDGVVHIFREKPRRSNFNAKQNVAVLEDMEFIVKLAYQELSKREQDFEFAEQNDFSLSLKIKTRFVNGVDNKCKAVIDGWLYDVKYADKTKTEIYLHLEEVRKIDS
ncbi:MAG: phage head closure protein [Tyzzerella sp.]|nr:phage head closure protein [Tyzzerella sp.]